MSKLNAYIRSNPLYAGILLIAGILVGCNLTSTASSSGGLPTNVHIQVFHAHKSASMDAVQTRAMNSGGVMTRATVTASGSALGTLSGYLAVDFTNGQRPLVPSAEQSATHIQIHSASNSSIATYAMADGKLQPQFPLDYESNDCSGTPFAGAWVAANALQQGVAFRDAVGGDSDQSSYWYLSPGTSLVSATIASQRIGPDGHCVVFGSPISTSEYPVVQNTQDLSGFPNAPLGALVVD